MQEKTINFIKNNDKISINILSHKSITKEDIKAIKESIYKNIICNNKYNYDMTNYYIKELEYKNIKLYNIKYIYYLLNMTTKKAILNLTF